MAVSVTTWVWDHSRSQHSARLVLLAIADYLNEERPREAAWPSVAAIAKKTALTERAVRAAIRDLAVMGELVVEYNAGRGGCNRYRVPMTPAKSSPPLQSFQGEDFAGGGKAESAHVNGHDPANSAPPENSSPLKKTTGDPANSAGGTRSNQKTKSKASAQKQRGKPDAAKTAKHEVADALAAGFWEVHKSRTAQSFIAIRQIIRTAISNGLPRNDVARALDKLAREQRAISGGAITNALRELGAQGNGGASGAPGPDRARGWMAAGRAFQEQSEQARKELPA